VLRVIAAAIAAALLAACSGGAVEGERIDGVRPGVTLPAAADRPAAPDAAAPLLDGSGEASVVDYDGQVLVLNFWASWCGPCRVEQPELNEAYARLAGDDVAFLGVAIQDSEANARAHEREFEVPYPSLHDPSNRYAAEYEGVGPRSIPTTIVIDRQGRVAARLFGTTNEREVTALVERLVTET
jgi:peroxiredoxin